MTVEEYLGQVQGIDVKIGQDLQTLKELKMLTLGMKSASDYSSPAVQSSGDGGAFTHLLDRIADLEAEIDRKTDAYIDTKNRIIDEIQSLPSTQSVDILYEIYISGKTVKDYAQERHYAREYAYALKKAALTEFMQKYSDYFKGV